MTSRDREQEERRQVLENDRLVREERSLLAQAQAQIDLESPGGRFKREASVHITGSQRVPIYPRQPGSSPWHHDPVPNEEPLGVSVAEAPIVGTLSEQDQAAAILEQRQKSPEKLAPVFSSGASLGDTAGPSPPNAVSPPSPFRRRA
jgi:hypothetical protein